MFPYNSIDNNFSQHFLATTTLPHEAQNSGMFSPPKKSPITDRDVQDNSPVFTPPTGTNRGRDRSEITRDQDNDTTAPENTAESRDSDTTQQPKMEADSSQAVSEEPTMSAEYSSAILEISEVLMCSIDEESLIKDACEIVSRTLNIEYASVFEEDLPSRYLVLRAGHGWQEGMYDTAIASPQLGSHIGYAMMTEGPVTASDYDTEQRFELAPALRISNIKSGIACAFTPHDPAENGGQTSAKEARYEVLDPQEPKKTISGLLTVHSTSVRDYSSVERFFVAKASHLIGHAISKLRLRLHLQYQISQQENKTRIESLKHQVVTEIFQLVAKSTNHLDIASAAAQKIASIVGAFCIVDICTSSHSINRFGAASPAPNATGCAWKNYSYMSLTPSIERVIQTGSPIVFDGDLEETNLTQRIAGNDKQTKKLISKYHTGYLSIFPITIARKTVGSLTLLPGSTLNPRIYQELASALSLTLASVIAVTPHVQSSNKSQEISKCSLSSRELEIISLMAEGFTENNIARKLALSRNTISWHRKVIYKKLDAKERGSAISTAVSLGYLQNTA